jgi:hypothetical protein
MLENCTGLFSLELPENTNQVEGWCCSLCNVALASNTVVAHDAFINCRDLLRIFGTVEAIVDALRNRFDGLPFHSKMYYKFYQETGSSIPL